MQFTKDLKKYLKPNAVMSWKNIDELQKRYEVCKHHIDMLISKKESLGTTLWINFFEDDLKRLNKKREDLELIFERLDLGQILVSETQDGVA